jgi:hypothetical protein
MMHAYAYAMQMQCNYGAKHLRCYNIAHVVHILSQFVSFYTFIHYVHLLQASISIVRCLA